MAILTQNIAHSTFFTPQAYRVVLYTEPQIKRFVRFVRLLPFGQWVFDKSHVQKNRSAFSCKIRLKDSSDSLDYFPLISGSSTNLVFKKIAVLFHAKSVLNPPCPVKVQSKSKENQKKNQKKKSKNESVKRLRCISDTP